MSSKIALITGCNSGIGKVTAAELAKKGYEIIMLVRESEKSATAFKELKEESGTENIHLYFADLASLSSVAKAAEKIMADFNHIDVLINNAGVYKRKYEETEDGFEMTFGVNYLATALLSMKVLPLLKQSKDPRVINLSSELYKSGDTELSKLFKPKKFNGDKAYANSKLLVIYFTKKLALLVKDDGVKVNCVHPGVVATDVFREYPKWFAAMLNLFISKPKDGAKPSIYLASSSDVKNLSGKYFNKLKEQETKAIANDEKLSTEIWEKTMAIIEKF